MQYHYEPTIWGDIFHVEAGKKTKRFKIRKHPEHVGMYALVQDYPGMQSLPGYADRRHIILTADSYAELVRALRFYANNQKWNGKLLKTGFLSRMRLWLKTAIGGAPKW